MTLNRDSVLGKVIFLAETLEGSKLEDSALKEARQELAALCSYLGVDEISAIFFSVMFVLQNKNEHPVTLHDIAEFLDYSFLHILEYRRNISILEDAGLISMKERTNVSHHPENNGYAIHGSVMNYVIDGEAIPKLEKAEKNTESIFEEVLVIQSAFVDNTMDFSEYSRQLMMLEKKNSWNEVISNVRQLFPNDFDSRSFLYYFCVALINGSEPGEAVRKRGCGWCETPAFALISPGKRSRRKLALMTEKDDVLLKNDLLAPDYQDVDEDFGRHRMMCRTFRLTANGIKTLFGSEAGTYLEEDKQETDLDRTLKALPLLSDIYENRDCSKGSKRRQLRREEEALLGLPFFSAIHSAVQQEDYRFFLYDCTNDFLNGAKSCLSSTLADLYDHDGAYFSEMRLFLDEKHPLLTMGFLEIEKDEVIEKTTLGLGDKTLDLLYGENSDLYKRSSSARNVIAPEKIKKKTLFYSEEVQQQIDMLTQSFNQEKLEAMQARLEQKALPKGIAVILYGAPGTGKTETVFQLAKKTNRKVLHVDIAESKSMWFGESEKRIKRIFTNYAHLCGECRKHGENTPILLFNEADALISKRMDVDRSSCAQTENAIQNILLEELEKLEGILIATTNLCENMDAAFERRFLFKIKYEKPSLQARTHIWTSKMPELDPHDAERLAGQFDFSGGEIDNVVRKCEMNEIIKGTPPCYDELVELCSRERLEDGSGHGVGFRYE